MRERMNPLACNDRAWQTTSFMPWRNRQSQKDFVLHQFGYIQFARHRQEITRVVFHLVLRHLNTFRKQFQENIDIKLERNGFKTALTGQQERSRNLKMQQRLSPFPGQSADAEAHFSSRLG